MSEMKNVLRVPISMHCYNDMGLTVANTLTDIEVGVEIYQVTVNDIGKRIGNAALEEVMVNLFTNYEVEVVDMTKLSLVFNLVEKSLGSRLRTRGGQEHLHPRVRDPHVRRHG